MTAFWQRYRGKTSDERLKVLLGRVKQPTPYLTAVRLSVTLLSARPATDFDTYETLVRARLPKQTAAVRRGPAQALRKVREGQVRPERPGLPVAHPSAGTVDGGISRQPSRRHPDRGAQGQRGRAAIRLQVAVQDPQQARAGRPHPHAVGEGGVRTRWPSAGSGSAIRSIR